MDIFKGILIAFFLAGAFTLVAAAFFLWKAGKLLREKPIQESSKFCSFRNRKAKKLRDENNLTEEEYLEIERHTENNMDEELIWSDAALPKKYLRGPTINEKYGPGSPWQREMK